MRPELEPQINPDEFKNYYYLKEELISFCRVLGISATGGKREITERIYEYLKIGKIADPLAKPSKKTAEEHELSLESFIPEGYKNDQRHRAFFTSVIGEHFKFNVAFMNWMKENAGKPYSEAVKAWKIIEEEKKQGKKTDIAPQFEYNRYFREFFAANKNLSRQQAIICWKYKKSLPGHNRYEDSDLIALEE